MAIPFVATETRHGDVRLAKHGETGEGLVIQSNDPRLGGAVGWTRIYMIATAPTPALGGIGEFAFARDKKAFYFKDTTGWELMGQLFKNVTNAEATVVTPTHGDGTIQVSTL